MRPPPWGLLGDPAAVEISFYPPETTVTGAISEPWFLVADASVSPLPPRCQPAAHTLAASRGDLVSIGAQLGPRVLPHLRMLP
jgi:hypothetical protein